MQNIFFFQEAVRLPFDSEAYLERFPVVCEREFFASGESSKEVGLKSWEVLKRDFPVSIRGPTSGVLLGANAHLISCFARDPSRHCLDSRTACTFQIGRAHV